jgi:hypothetical protein
MGKPPEEILIKAVAQAIPTFAMGCFDLSKTLCDQIGAMICRFLWNHPEDKHKIHWLSMEQMLKPKQEGGLGFRYGSRFLPIVVMQICADI